VFEPTPFSVLAIAEGEYLHTFCYTSIILGLLRRP
jgi:hypothetical protein